MSSEIKANSIQDKTGTRVLASDSGSAWSWGTGVPAGTIINVSSLTRSSTDSHSNSTPKEITGLTHTISNPKSGSKFYLTGHINMSWDYAQTKGALFITRTDADGEATIALGDANGSRVRAHAYAYINIENYSPFGFPINFLDSPNTSGSIVYKVKFSSMDNIAIIYINRSDSWVDSSNYATTVSTFTVFEVAQ